MKFRHAYRLPVVAAALFVAACAGQTSTSTDLAAVDNAPVSNVAVEADNVAAAQAVALQTTEVPRSFTMPVSESGEVIVARVNGVDILQVDLNRAMSRYLAQQYASMNETALRTEVLFSLIEQALIEQAAAEQNVVVTDAEVQAEIDANMQIAGSEDAWRQWLASNLYTPDEFRETLRATLITARMRDQVTRNVNASVPHVHARHILVATEAQANDLVTRLSNGEDFAGLAAAYSNDVTTREQGGDLGWFAEGELLEPYLAQVAFALEPGQINGPVATSLGFHVVQTIERADRPIPEEKRPIVAQGQFESWIQNLVSRATIEVF